MAESVFLSLANVYDPQQTSQMPSLSCCSTVVLGTKYFVQNTAWWRRAGHMGVRDGPHWPRTLRKDTRYIGPKETRATLRSAIDYKSAEKSG